MMELSMLDAYAVSTSSFTLSQLQANAVKDRDA